MLRRVVHRLRPISSHIFQNGVLAATSSANRAFSAAVNLGCAIATLPIGTNPDQVSRFDDPLRPQAVMGRWVRQFDRLRSMTPDENRSRVLRLFDEVVNAHDAT